MAGPLAGIKVVELGFWVAGPACGGILADWGAEVVKVEPMTGDPMRGMTHAWQMYYGRDGNPPFELDNRGKRSIGLDYGTPDGMAVLLELIDGADVFVTNLRVPALARAGLDHAALSARNERLVYASISGLGLVGPDADRPAYDVGSFWSRAGVAAALTPEGQPLPYQRGGMGDHMTGLAAAGGVMAALFARERSGVGQQVSTSLLRIGSYMMGWDLNLALRFGAQTVPMSRSTAPNPVINTYTCSDGKRFWLLGLEGDRHWPFLLAAIGRPDLGEDPRFAESTTRTMHAAELIAELDQVFATGSRNEWTDRFDDAGVWWAPVQSTHELLDDPQAHAAGCFVDTPLPDGTSTPMPSTPVDFSSHQCEPSGPSPEFGQHTEEVLLDMGYDWDRIIALKETGSIL
jgi:crotonobetainyl-CoA:carnitine CoA-transferase CaiB-like acyl-CoA transferase